MNVDAQYLTVEETAQVLHIDTREVHAMLARGELMAFPLAGQQKIPRTAVERAHLSSNARALMVFDDTPPQPEFIARTIKQKMEVFRQKTGLTAAQYVKNFEAGLLDLMKNDIAVWAIEAEELLAEQKEKKLKQGH